MKSVNELLNYYIIRAELHFLKLIQTNLIPNWVLKRLTLR